MVVNVLKGSGGSSLRLGDYLLLYETPDYYLLAGVVSGVGFRVLYTPYYMYSYRNTWVYILHNNINIKDMWLVWHWMLVQQFLLI